MSQTRRVVVVAYQAAELLDIACVATTFQAANVVAGKAIYHISVVSPGGLPIATAGGLTLNADGMIERTTGPIDTLVIAGGYGYVAAMESKGLIAHVRRLSRESRRVASVCTGAGILAAAGLLDGRRAATHWAHAPYLAGRFPKVHFDSDPIFVRDNTLSTSAGVTAALDLTLALIEEDGGADLARGVSRQLVTYLQRPGNQAQMSMFTSPPAAGSSIVHDTIAHIAAHLADDLSTPTLAARAGVSERQLARLFLRDLQLTPGRYVRRVRTEAAAHLLTGTDLTIETIASRCGFGTAETLRQAFQSQFGVAPSHYRATQSRAWATAEGITERGPASA